MCKILTKKPEIEITSKPIYVYKVVLKESDSIYKSLLRDFTYELNKESVSDIIWIQSPIKEKIFLTDEGLYCFKKPLHAIELLLRHRSTITQGPFSYLLKCRIPSGSSIIDCNKFVGNNSITYHPETDVITFKDDIIITNKLIPISVYNYKKYNQHGKR